MSSHNRQQHPVNDGSDSHDLMMTDGLDERSMALMDKEACGTTKTINDAQGQTESDSSEAQVKTDGALTVEKPSLSSAEMLGDTMGKSCRPCCHSRRTLALTITFQSQPPAQAPKPGSQTKKRELPSRDRLLASLKAGVEVSQSRRRPAYRQTLMTSSTPPRLGWEMAQMV